jgi:hypothetical protein
MPREGESMEEEEEEEEEEEGGGCTPRACQWDLGLSF